MSQADELLNSLNEGIAVTSVNPETEPHIVIDNDRNITVPDELRRIAVQYDHNIETVTFDCPRYWDGHDLSAMTVYINYMRADGEKGFFVAEDITIDENDTDIMHFTWTISKNVTMYKGSVSFLVCITSVDDEGNEELHWNSELCNQISVSEGLECHEAVEEEYPDIYTQLVDLVNANTFSDYYKDMIYKNASDIGVHTNEISVLNSNVSSLQTGLSATVSRVTKLDDRVTANETAINRNTSDINAVDARVDSLFDADTQFSKDIASVNMTATIAQSRADNALERVTELKNDLDASELLNKARFAEHTEDIDYLNTNVETNTTNIGVHTNEISVLNNNVSSLQTGLSATVSRVTELKNDIQRIKDNAGGVSINKSTLGYQKKNLLKVTASTQVNTGITYTVNSDKSITANGTQSHASATSYLTIGNFTAPFDGEYILTGYPEGDTSVNTSLGYLQYGATVVRNLVHKLTMSKGETISLMLCVKAGSVLENRIFKPMIRSADITDDTYEPYVEDVNTRITENKNDIAINKTTLGYEKKNLFNPNAVNWYQPAKTLIAEDGTITSTATSDSRSWSLANAEYFLTLPAGKYIVKTITESLSENSTNENIRGYNEAGSQVFEIYPNIVGTRTTTFTIDETATIGFMFKLITQTCKIMVYNADITDDTYEPYVKSVKERLDGQSQLYSNTSVSDSVLTVNISNLFADYSAVICNIVTSNGRYTQVLPLKYIKSLGTSTYYQAGEMIYYYVDDSNLKIYTGLGQSNPTISSAQIIGLY